MARSSPPRGSRRHLSSSVSRRNPPPRPVRSQSCLTLVWHFPKRGGILTCEIIAAFESEDYDLDETTLIDSTSLCNISMNHAHQTSTYRLLKSLAKFVRTYNNFSLNQSTKNRSSYYLKWRMSSNSEELAVAAE